MTTTDTEAVSAALLERLLDALVSGSELMTVHLGRELGLYRVIHEHPGVTEQAVADLAGISLRYAREWLEQQSAASLIECDDPAALERTYRIPQAHADVLLREDNQLYGGGMAGLFAGLARALPRLPAAFKSGSGVPYAAYGEELRAGIAGLNRPGFLHRLGREWIAAVPEIDQRMRSAPPALVLDLGCGMGASTIALARVYPRIRVTGVDLDAASIVHAQAVAAREGVADRVTFVVGDAVEAIEGGPYDVVTIFEALHDMSDPAGILRSVRKSLAPDGSVFIADERNGDAFAGPADLVERLQYAVSVLHCLPATMAESPVEANGTVLRASTVARWAREAGFGDCRVLPIEHDFWRFYLLQDSQ